MSSVAISNEALADFINVNCAQEYRLRVVDKLGAALVQRNITIDTIYGVIEALNELQPKLNKLQIIACIFDAVLAIVSEFSGIAATCVGAVITGIHHLIKNNRWNGQIKQVRKAMIEDKRHRDSLQALLRQQWLELPSFELIEFKAETNIIHKIFSAISAYITGNNIEWVKHLENFGVIGIVPVDPSPAQKDMTKQSQYSLSDIFQMLTKGIDYLLGLVGPEKKVKQTFSAIKVVISLFHNCSKTTSESHPTINLLETKYIPELMHDAVMMQELQEKLLRK